MASHEGFSRTTLVATAVISAFAGLAVGTWFKAEPPPIIIRAPEPQQQAASPSSPSGQLPSVATPAPLSPPRPTAQDILERLTQKPPSTPVSSAPPVPPPPPILAQGHREAVLGIVATPDRKNIVSIAGDFRIKLWDAEQATVLRELGSHKSYIRAVLMLPDGKSILTAGDDQEIVLRTLPDGAPLHTFSTAGHGGVNSLALSPEGKRFLSGQEKGTIVLWDIETRAALSVMAGHAGRAGSVAFSPDGKQALSGGIDQTMRLWDLAAAKEIRRFSGHAQGIYSIAFAPDGRRGLSGSGDQTMRLWDLDSGSVLRTFSGHGGTIYSLAVSFDGRTVLTGALDGLAKLWSLDSGRELMSFLGHVSSVYSVAFVGDGTVLAGARDGSLRRWRMSDGAMLKLYPGAARE